MNLFRFQQLENYQRRSGAERHVPLSARPLGGNQKQHKQTHLYKMKSIIYITILFASVISVYAQDQEHLSTRTPQEKKINGGIFTVLVCFENQLSSGIPRDEAMFCFKNFLKDDSSRIYVVVVKKLSDIGDAKSAIMLTGGNIYRDYSSRTYCYVKPEALRSLIEVESIEIIDMFSPPRTN